MAKKSGILSQVIKASETKEDYLKVLLHGNSGAGKSTTCGTAPGNILYLWTERQGVISFKRVSPGSMTLHIDSLDKLRSILEELRAGGHGFDTVALDSLTEMQRMIVEEVVAQNPNKEDPTISDWNQIIKATSGLVRAYRDLEMNVVVTALSDEIVVGDSERFVRPALSGRKLPAQISQYFNIVGYAFKTIRNKMVHYKVLLEGNENFSCKGLPGLRYREEPDLSYWFDRVFKGAEPQDPKARMISDPSADKPEFELAPDEENGNGTTTESAAKE